MYHLQAQCVLLKGFTFHTYFVIWSGPQRSPPSSHPGIHMPGQDVKGFLFHSQPKQDLWFDTHKTAEYSTLFCIVYQNCCTCSTVTDSSTGQFSSSTSETCHFLPQKQLAPTQMEGTADMKAAYQVLEESTCLSHSRLESVADIREGKQGYRDTWFSTITFLNFLCNLLKGVSL